MTKYLRKILSLAVITAMSLSLLVVQTAYAADNVYGVTGGDTASLPVAGAASVALNNVVATDTAGTDFGDTETITVSINTASYPNVAFDSTVATVTISGTVGSSGTPAVTYGGGGTTATFTLLTGGGASANGETIIIAGLKVVTLYEKAAPGAAGLVTLDNDTTLNGGDVTSTTTVNLASTAEPQLTASITLGTNSVAGTAGNTTLTLTPPRALANTDTIVWTMPPNFSVPQGAITLSDNTLNGVGVFTCTGVAATRVITCTTNGAVTGDVSGNLVLAGIESLWDSAAATNVSDLTINDVAAGGGADIALDTTVAVDDTTPEPQLTASIALGTNSVAGTAGNTTLTLTPPRALANTDTIVWTMPTNFSVPEGAITLSDNTLNGAGVFTCTGVAATRVITCTTNGAVTGDVSGNLVLAGITSLWESAATNVSDLTINDVAAGGGLDIALDTTVAVTATTPGVIATANVEPQSMIATAAPVNVITFTTINTIPNLGKIKITYPSGYNVAGANGRTAFNLSGLDGTWTASVSGQVVTLTQTGGSLTSIGAKSLSLEGITNPSQTGTTGTYTIKTTYSTDEVRDSITTVTADSVITGGSTSSSSSSGSSNTTAATTATTTTTTTTTTKDATTAETKTDADTAIETTTDTEEDTSVTTTTESGVVVTLKDTATHWATDEITAMVEMEIVKGNPDGSFKPDNALNRAEAATLLFRVLGMDEEEMSAPEEKPFSDVAVDSWYAIYVDTLKGLEVVKGNPDGTYAPGKNINRAEFLTLAMNAYYYMMAEEMGEVTVTDAFSDLDKSAWYAKTVSTAFEMKFVSGSACGTKKCFNAGSNITRAEATVMLYNIFFKEVELDEDEEMEEEAEPVVVNLTAQNTSGESGTATFTEVDGKVKVVLALTGAPKDVEQPAHIHMGSCATPGDVKYALTSPKNGASETMLDVSWAKLVEGLPLMVNVHKSAAESSVYYACGDIKE